MNKRELVREVAITASWIQKDMTKTVSAVFDVIKEELINGGFVDIPYFGRFEVKIKYGRKYPVFIPSKDLRLIIKYNL